MSAEQANTQTKFEETQPSLGANASEVHHKDSETASKSDTPSTVSYDMTSQPPPFEESLKNRGDLAVDSRNDSHRVNYWTGEPDTPTAFTGDESPVAEEHSFAGSGPSESAPMTDTVDDSYLEDFWKYDVLALQDYLYGEKKSNEETVPEGSAEPPGVAFSGLRDPDNESVESHQEEEQTPLPSNASQNGIPSPRDAGYLWRLAARKAKEVANGTAEEEEDHPTDSSVPTPK